MKRNTKCSILTNTLMSEHHIIMCHTWMSTATDHEQWYCSHWMHNKNLSGIRYAIWESVLLNMWPLLVLRWPCALCGSLICRVVWSFSVGSRPKPPTMPGLGPPGKKRSWWLCCHHDRFGDGCVMGWGAISFNHKSSLEITYGTITAMKYRDQILEPVAVPFGLQSVGRGFLLQDDNARSHRGRVLTDFHDLIRNIYTWTGLPTVQTEHYWRCVGHARQIRQKCAAQ